MSSNRAQTTGGMGVIPPFDRTEKERRQNERQRIRQEQPHIYFQIGYDTFLNEAEADLCDTLQEMDRLQADIATFDHAHEDMKAAADGYGDAMFEVDKLRAENALFQQEIVKFDDLVLRLLGEKEQAEQQLATLREALEQASAYVPCDCNGQDISGGEPHLETCTREIVWRALTPPEDH